MPTFIIVKWDSKFDGDSNHKPASMGVTASYRPSGPDAEANYRQKLGQRFMVESDRAEEGKKRSQDSILMSHSDLLPLEQSTYC